MIVYRLAKEKRKGDLSGTGAELHGARWNNKGNKMLYTSDSPALAMAEVAVHLPFAFLPKDYFLISIKLPKLKFFEIDMSVLKGTNWNSHPPSNLTQDLGDNFLKTNNFLICKVPSVVVPDSFNFLINPLHKDFKKVKIVKLAPFVFDARLFH